MRLLSTSLCLAFAVLAPPAVAARAAPSDAAARVEPAADGVDVIVHDNATEEWPHGNTGVVVGETGVLVVDSTYLPSRARADIALIKKITDKPVRYLAYTHWHFDHNNGGIAYRQAFPAVDVVSARDPARSIELNGVWWSRRQSAAGSSHRKAELQELAGLEVVTPNLTFEDKSLDEDWRETVKALVERSFRGVRGQG